MQAILGLAERGITVVSDKPASSSAPLVDVESFAGMVDDTITRTNAPILSKKKAEDAEQDLMEKRILEVGLAKYIEEQQEVKKMMKLLYLMKLRSRPDVAEKIQEMIDQFKENPPVNVAEMMNTMTSAIAGIPDDAANALRKRMEEILQEINDMMQLSDEEIDALKKEAVGD